MGVGRQQGFTIIEAVVAMAIAGGGVVALAALTQQVTSSVHRARQTVSAAALADQGIATRVGRPLSATADSCLEVDTSGCMETLDADGQASTTSVAFVRRWRIVPLAVAPSPLSSVTVCVVSAVARMRRAAAPGACVTRLAGGVTP